MDEVEIDEAFSDDAAQISSILSECQRPLARLAVSALPAVQDNRPQNAFSAADPSDIDLSSLVDLRLQHQTKQAFSGVRSSGILKTHSADNSPIKQLTERQKLLKGFAEVLREVGDKGVGSGLERSARWKRNPAPGGRDAENVDGVDAPTATGNTANAAEVAKSAAKKVSHLFLVKSQHLVLKLVSLRP